MKKLIQGSWAVLLFLLVSVACAKGVSPVGYWRTYDEVTGKQKAVMRIFENHGYLYGQIVKTFTPPGVVPYTICTACRGNRHNQPIIGMVIMEGLSQNVDKPQEWKNGKILDPTTGKTYRCMITLMGEGRKLNIRGYLGFSMFGRTQTWVRTNSA